MELLNELVGFVESNDRLDVKSLALHHILSLTGNIESRHLLLTHPKLLDVLTQLAFDESQQKAISKDAFFSLINLAADELDAHKMLQAKKNLVSNLLNYILNAESKFSDTACAVLSNLSRGKTNSELIFNTYFASGRDDDDSAVATTNLDKLLQVFCTENFNKTNRLDYLAPFICNLTQLEAAQERILNDSLILQRLLPYTTYKRSMIRRGGIVGAIKNCCFNYG
jgi:hypothetical protein